MSNDLVSIIIPTYNRAAYISDTLDSILAQTHNNWECIIVDDGSIDETKLIVQLYCQKDTRFKLYSRPETRTKGANSCRNFGFEVCNGLFVNWFDDDDLMQKDKLKLQIQNIQDNNSNYSICQTSVFSDDASKTLRLLHEKIVSDNPFEDYMMQKIVWLTQAPIFKKPFLDLMDYLFDEDLQASQEWEFFCRVLLIDEQYSYIDEPLVFNRIHADRMGVRKSFANERIFNYYKARIKIENILFKKFGAKKYYDFFTKYYLYCFRHLILNKNRKLSYTIFAESIYQRLPLIKLIKICLISVFYLFFGRGESILKKIVS